MPDATSVLLVILRWIHFLWGVTWIGTIFYLRAVELPFMKSRGDLRLSADAISRLNLVLVATSIIGLTAGVVMALFLTGLNANVFTSSPWGFSIFIGAIFALVALVATFAGFIPTLERLSSEKRSASEQALLLRKGELWLNLAALSGVLVLFMMAYAGSLGFG